MATGIQNIPDTECIGTSLIKINDNFAYLDQQTSSCTTMISSLSSFVTSIGSTAITTSNFVYSVYTDGNGLSDSGTIKMTNTWQDVFIDKNLTPLRVLFNNSTPYTYTALLQGKVYARNYRMAATSFYRLAQFSSLTNAASGVPDAPTAVIDTAACEGDNIHSHAYNTILQSVVTIQPNTSYVFGIQTWLPSDGAHNNGGIQINGWQTISSDAWKTSAPWSVNYLPSSYTNSYANGNTIGYPNGGTYNDPLSSVGVFSHLKLIII